uniref:Tom7-domain-containing protein n=1 Tax=Schizophyllum commune (strain H4-8 / FGSC 9210) TaxID=578458 RepID=D8PJV6_SCHCM
MPSEDTKERIAKFIEIGRTILHYGWVPAVIYIGFTRSNPQPSLIKYVLRCRCQLLSLTRAFLRLISPLA